MKKTVSVTMCMRDVIKEFQKVADGIDAKANSTEKIGDRMVEVSREAALALLVSDILPTGAIIMNAEYGSCVCDDGDEEGHRCWDEILPEDIENVLNDECYETFSVWF